MRALWSKSRPAAYARAALQKLAARKAEPKFPAARSVASSTASPSRSALALSAQRLRDTIAGNQAAAEIAALADAPVDTAKSLERLRHELRQSEEDVPVTLFGEELDPTSRKVVTIPTPTGPSGGAAVRFVRMPLPTSEDVTKLLQRRREEKPAVAKAQELADILEKWLNEKYLAKSADHVALLSAWGPKALGDAEGEFAEVAALMLQFIRGYKAALQASKEDLQFEVNRAGDGKDCLVMPPSNFALLGLKDAFHMLLKGYRVLLVVQPRFFTHFREIQQDFAESGLQLGLLEVLPGITPDADPDVLHTVLKQVDRLQFTGSSAMFKSLVLKAYELGNLRLEHAGEVSGLNKVRLDGVSGTHPAAATGAAWAAIANNGELCTSASLVEFDPATGDTPEKLKAALEAHPFKLGRDVFDPSLDVLLKDGKTEALQVLTKEPPSGFKEWWEKTVLVVPQGSDLKLRTNQSLGHCIFSTSIERAVSLGVKEEASCLYLCAVPEDTSAPSARAGTTGCKIPESVFGGMKTYTYAVAGDHDGVGSVQTILDTVKRRGPSWRDQEEAYAKYELTETGEMLLEFLSPRDQVMFSKQVNSVLEVFKAFEPEISNPYNGPKLVGAEGRSQLVTLPALRPARKNLLIPRGVGLPEDIVKLALLVEMSPLREVPVDLHLLQAQQVGKLQVTDPLKSFLRVVEKRLGWRLHYYANSEELAAKLRAAEYPPYFFCVKDRHMLPLEVLKAVAEQGGYFYEGLPSDALSLFRTLTATQAWTVSCTADKVEEAAEELRKAWKTTALREEPLEPAEIVQPKGRDPDVGGGFTGGLGAQDDNEWGELDDSDDEDIPGKDVKATPDPVKAGGA